MKGVLSRTALAPRTVISRGSHVAAARPKAASAAARSAGSAAQRTAVECTMSGKCGAYVESRLAQPSVSGLSGGFFQRQRMPRRPQILPQAARSPGQPRPISRLSRAGQPAMWVLLATWRGAGSGAPGGGLASDLSPPPTAGMPPAATMAAWRHSRMRAMAPSQSSYLVRVRVKVTARVRVGVRVRVRVGLGLG